MILSHIKKYFASQKFIKNILKNIYFLINKQIISNTDQQTTTSLYLIQNTKKHLCFTLPLSPWVLEMDFYIILDCLTSGKLSTNKDIRQNQLQKKKKKTEREKWFTGQLHSFVSPFELVLPI